MTKARTMRFWALAAIAGLALGGAMACTGKQNTYPTQPPARNVGDTEIGDLGDLIAAFSFEQDGDNETLTVIFTDESIGIITKWLWDFGDGKKSSAQNPVHTYKSPGTYIVTLTVSNADTSDSVSAFVSFETEEAGPPSASFSCVVDVVDLLKIVCTDNSTGAITSRSWDFGDGSGSGAKNPTHTYAEAGTYVVSLTVSGPAGSDSASAFVVVGEAPPPPPPGGAPGD